MPTSLFSLLLFLLFTPLPSTGAQRLPPPPTSSPSSSSSLSVTYSIGGLISPLASILITFLFVLCFITAFSVYIIRHTTSAAASASTAAAGNGDGSYRRRGLDPVTLETFPTFVYSAIKGHRIGKASLECMVCLADFGDDDTLRLMPACEHAFHPYCIGTWLASHTTCPVCRADLSLRPLPPPTNCSTDSAPSLPGEPTPEEGSRRSEGVDEREQVEPSAGAEAIIGEKIECLNRVHPRDVSSQVIKFTRSHSTGHSLVRPGENMERFTLRLPVEVKKQLMDQAGSVLSLREGSSGGRFISAAEGSSRGGKHFRRTQRLVSDRWVLSRMPSFWTPMLSLRSPRLMAATNDADGRPSRGSSCHRPSV